METKLKEKDFYHENCNFQHLGNGIECNFHCNSRKHNNKYQIYTPHSRIQIRNLFLKKKNGLLKQKYIYTYKINQLISKLLGKKHTESPPYIFGEWNEYCV
jgi:hypothetical protein